MRSSQLCRFVALAASIAFLGACGRELWSGAASGSESRARAPNGANTAGSAPAPFAPTALPQGCSLFVGSSSGNDEVMNTRLALCPAPGGVSGWVQFVSRVSGWSLRDVAGTVDASGELRLRDVRFVESHPSEEWEFCPVDEYHLRQIHPGEVEGVYVSNQCGDHAKMALRRVQ